MQTLGLKSFCSGPGERQWGSEDDKRSYLEYILKMNWNSGYILEVEPTKLADRMELGYERKHRTKEEKQ